jgi:hypothetical protein
MVRLLLLLLQGVLTAAAAVPNLHNKRQRQHAPTVRVAAGSIAAGMRCNACTRSVNSSLVSACTCTAPTELYGFQAAVAAGQG